jgi:hemerythrin
MALTWTQDLSVGVKEIDAQHRELFKRINSLLDAMSEGKGKGEVSTLLAFLEGYVIEHFRTEEGYMVRHGYPEYHSHRALHKGFNKDLRDIKQDLETKGLSSVLVISVQRHICDWWREHVAKRDKAFGNYLNDTSPPPLKFFK